MTSALKQFLSDAVLSVDICRMRFGEDSIEFAEAAIELKQLIEQSMNPSAAAETKANWKVINSRPRFRTILVGKIV